MVKDIMRSDLPSVDLYEPFIAQHVQPKTNNATTTTTTELKYKDHYSGQSERCYRRTVKESNSTRTSKKSCNYNLVSNLPKNTNAPIIFVKEQTVQPMLENKSNKYTETITNGDNLCGKKRSRSIKLLKSTNELRIEAGSNYDVNVIINEIRSKTFITTTTNNKYSSLYLKGVQLSTRRLCENKILLNAFKYLVDHQGSSWKIIKIHDCSPWIVEAVLSSPYSTNFEEVHLVNMHGIDSVLLKSSLPFECLPQQRQHHQSSSSLHSSQSISSHHASVNVKKATLSSLITYLLNKTVRLKRLVLKDCNLEDIHLFQVMSILCSNHSKTLESLDIRYNKFTSRGIQSVVANHLRLSLHSLKTISLRQGIRCVVNPKIRDAIIQGLQHNRVILESIDIFDWDRSVQHFLDINRAGRREVFCKEHFQRNLWPLLLERATSKLQLSIVPPVRRRIAARQANVLYHMLRNGGPMLLQQQ